jgi:hypothetical protein
VAVVPDEAAPPAADVQPPEPADIAAPAASPPVQYAAEAGKPGVLTYRTAEQPEWAVLPPRAMAHPNEQLASLEAFNSELVVGGNSCRVILLGGTRAMLMPPTAAGAFGLLVDRGRIVFERPAGDGQPADAEPFAVAVQKGNTLWRIELLTAGTRCGLEVVPRKPQALEQVGGPDNYDARLIVTRGDVRIADASGWSRSLGAENVVNVTPGDRAMAAVELLASLPGWAASAEGGYEQEISSNVAVQFQQALDDNALVTRLKPVAKSSRPRVAELGARAQGLLGYYEELVLNLSYSDLFEEARLASIEELRIWLGSDPQAGESLRMALEGAFPADTVDTMYELLWGYSAEDLGDQLTSQKLANYLENSHFAVRQLAHYHIRGLTGNDFRYQPLDPPLQRRIAVENIRSHIRTKGSLLAR